MDSSQARATTGGGGIFDGTAITRSGQDASLHALHVVEYAIAAPAPRRERTWRHRLKIAVDALAEAIDRQIADNDDSIGLLAELALSEPEHTQAVIGLRDQQRALRVAIASLREQLEEYPELPIDTTHIRQRFAELADQYRQHRTGEIDLIHTALGVDITDHPTE